MQLTCRIYFLDRWRLRAKPGLDAGAGTGESPPPKLPTSRPTAAAPAAPPVPRPPPSVVATALRLWPAAAPAAASAAATPACRRVSAFITPPRPPQFLDPDRPSRGLGLYRAAAIATAAALVAAATRCLYPGDADPLRCCAPARLQPSARLAIRRPPPRSFQSSGLVWMARRRLL